MNNKTPIVTLTDAAIKELQLRMKSSDSDYYGLRIGLKKGGCAGMEYTMEYASEAQPHDEVIEQDNVRVLIAPAAIMFMFGTVIDYEDSLLSSGFTFKNPNVTESCGCGESIRFSNQ